MSDVNELANDTDKRLSVHEAVCASRYENIYKSLDSAYKRANRIEYLIYIVIAAVLLGPGAAAEFFKKFIGL
jgi:hypothetical protein